MLDYLRQLFQLTFAISVMYILLDCQVKIKKNAYLLGLYAVVVIIADSLVLSHLGYTNFMRLYHLIVQIPVLLAFMSISKFKPIKVLFVHLTLVAITASFTTIGLIISYFLSSGREVANIICYILYLPSWALIYKFIRPSFLYMMHNADKGWLAQFFHTLNQLIEGVPHRIASAILWGFFIVKFT